MDMLISDTVTTVSDAPGEIYFISLSNMDTLSSEQMCSSHLRLTSYDKLTKIYQYLCPKCACGVQILKGTIKKWYFGNRKEYAIFVHKDTHIHLKQLIRKI